MVILNLRPRQAFAYTKLICVLAEAEKAPLLSSWLKIGSLILLEVLGGGVQSTSDLHVILKRFILKRYWDIVL